MFSDSKNVPWWIALVLTFGGLLAIQRATSPPSDRPAAEGIVEPRSGPMEARPTDEGAWLLPLETFVGHERSKKPAPPPPAPQPLRLEIRIPLLEEVEPPATVPLPAEKSQQFDAAFIGKLQKQVDRLDFLIVTVADAKETQSNYRFDLHLDALHKAVGAEGMVLDGYQLPWDDPDPTKARREPGVLLYRKARGAEGLKNDLLLVFLVGELPTTGIHKAAFAQSVSRIVRLRTSFADNAVCSTISVAGPIFSGSGDSLASSIAQATQADEELGLQFNVITGSANVVNVGRFNKLAGPNTTFHSTLIRNDRLRSALINFVTRNNLERTPIAWLAESSSGTGANTLLNLEDKERNLEGKERNESARERSNRGDKAKERLDPADDRVEMYEFLFPLNIARVREVYAEQGRREQAGQPALGPGRYRLTIPFGETNSARDMPRMQTPHMTAPSSEIVLSQMLNTIRLRRIKYVVISSIDARDPIFLAEMVKRHCPDAQIMLVSPDIMQLHTEFRSVLHGALVASTHSLNPEEQTWCFPFGKVGEHGSRYRVMASQSYYGIYNAVIFLRGLDKQSLLLNSNTIAKGPQWSDRSPPPLPIAYGPPLEMETSFAPPVWISRLGPTGFHPVAIEPTQGEHDPELIRLDIPVAVQPRFNGHIPVPARTCAMFWLAAAAVYWLGWKGKSGNWSVPLNENSWVRNYVVLPQLFRASMTATFVCMLALWALLMTPPLFPSSGIGRSGWILNLLHLVGCVGLAILFMPLLGEDLWQALKQGRRPISVVVATAQAGVLELLGCMRMLLLAIVLALVVALVVVPAMQIAEFLTYPDRFLFWFASWSDLWNGISFLPALQFLAITALLLAYGMLHQVSLLHRSEVLGIPTGDNERQRSPGDLWARLLFPLLKRYEWLGLALTYYRRRRRSPAKRPADERGRWIVLAICVVGGLAWLAYVLSQVPSSDFFSAQVPWLRVPLNGVHTLFLVICAYWFLRYMKLLELMRSFLRDLERQPPRNWNALFRDHKLVMPSLADLLIWPSWPRDDEVKKARRELAQQLALPPQYLTLQLSEAREKLFVVRMQHYVRQLCFHCSRLLVGILIGALLIFLAANSYPYHMQPLLRLTSSLILAAVAIAMTWFYIKLDRNPVISGIVGTEPHQVQFNWSLIQTLVPALGLTLLAFLSQAFPDLWQWIRETIEPSRRV